jgi:hypothetical protein
MACRGEMLRELVKPELISGFTISGPCSVRRMEVQSLTLDNNGMNLGPERDAV